MKERLLLLFPAIVRFAYELINLIVGLLYVFSFRFSTQWRGGLFGNISLSDVNFILNIYGVIFSLLVIIYCKKSNAKKWLKILIIIDLVLLLLNFVLSSTQIQFSFSDPRLYLGFCTSTLPLLILSAVMLVGLNKISDR